MSSACPTGALTGKDGNVVCDTVRLARITQWTLTETVGVTEFADSDSGGFTNRLPQRKEASGTFDFKFDDTYPQYDRIRAGECCHLVLFMTPTIWWDIPVALITSLGFTVNVEDLEVEEGTADWQSSGIFYAPGESPHSHTLPAGPS